MSDNHKHFRDEQFWYTAAVVGLNTLVVKLDADVVPGLLPLAATGLVSVFGVHLILARWLRDAIDGGRVAPPPFDNKSATAFQRARYTAWEIGAYGRDILYVFAELSGTLFYLLLIGLTFACVVIRFLN